MFAGVIVVLGAGFGGDDVRLGADQRDVPGGGHANGLGKNGGGAGAPDAVKAFVPIVVGGNVQPRNGRSGIAHLLHFFRERHPAHQIVDARGDRLRGVIPNYRRADQWRLPGVGISFVDLCAAGHGGN